MVHVRSTAKDLPAGRTAEKTSTIEAGGQRQPVTVRLHAPTPANLAEEAKAVASSVWGPGFAAGRVNDGDMRTRWNSAKSEAHVAWIELQWNRDVTFRRVVMDECTDFGLRVQAWHLEAGDDKLATIAEGKTLGDNFSVALPKPVTARRLRLVIDKSSQAPSIWEIRVH